MADPFKMEMGGDWAQGLDDLGEAIKEHLLRSGGNAMSEAFQAEAKARAPVFNGPRYFKHTKKGGYWVTPGQLRDSIYRVYAKGESNKNLAVYAVSWNHYKAPHGYWMENGNSRHPAHPFIRPAYEAVKQSALQVGIDRMRVRWAQVAPGVHA
ncbi:MAG: HK97 gp10 family phage protein [Ramlibacter sp.]